MVWHKLMFYRRAEEVKKTKEKPRILPLSSSQYHEGNMVIYALGQDEMSYSDRETPSGLRKEWQKELWLILTDVVRESKKEEAPPGCVLKALQSSLLHGGKA